MFPHHNYSLSFNLSTTYNSFSINLTCVFNEKSVQIKSTLRACISVLKGLETRFDRTRCAFPLINNKISSPYYLSTFIRPCLSFIRKRCGQLCQQLITLYEGHVSSSLLFVLVLSPPPILQTPLPSTQASLLINHKIIPAFASHITDTLFSSSLTPKQ